MNDSRRPGLVPWVAILAGVALALAAPTARAAGVYSTCQICTGNAAGDCETAPSVLGAGVLAEMSRLWAPGNGFSYAASTSISTDYGAFGAFARASGSETPPPGAGTTFLNNVTRIARSYGTVNDVFTAGTGGASGFVRIPMHVVGSVSISWQNGAGYASVSFSCASSAPGSPYAIGHCDPVTLLFTNDAAIDEVVNLDVPVVLGSPVEYTATVIADASTGHGYGDLIPFTGQSELHVATLSFPGAGVLDASRQPIPGATISLGESGFDYLAAPEAPSLLGGLAAVAALAPLRRRRLLPAAFRGAGVDAPRMRESDGRATV